MKGGVCSRHRERNHIMTVLLIPGRINLGKLRENQFHRVHHMMLNNPHLPDLYLHFRSRCWHNRTKILCMCLYILNQRGFDYQSGPKPCENPILRGRRRVLSLSSNVCYKSLHSKCYETLELVNFGSWICQEAN